MASPWQAIFALSFNPDKVWKSQLQCNKLCGNIGRWQQRRSGKLHALDTVPLTCPSSLHWVAALWNSSLSQRLALHAILKYHQLSQWLKLRSLCVSRGGFDTSPPVN